METLLRLLTAVGEGTAGEMTYVEYENAIWIVHSDTSHAGRKLYNFKNYIRNISIKLITFS